MAAPTKTISFTIDDGEPFVVDCSDYRYKCSKCEATELLWRHDDAMDEDLRCAKCLRMTMGEYLVWDGWLELTRPSRHWPAVERIKGLRLFKSGGQIKPGEVKGYASTFTPTIPLDAKEVGTWDGGRLLMGRSGDKSYYYLVIVGEHHDTYDKLTMACGITVVSLVKGADCITLVLSADPRQTVWGHLG